MAETWPTYNAGLNENERIKVRVPENLLKCKVKLNGLRRYYLILQRDTSDAGADFKLLEPMVPENMGRIRSHVNKGVCWKQYNCPIVAVKVAKHFVRKADSSGYFGTACRIQTILERDEYKVEWIFNNNVAEQVVSVNLEEDSLDVMEFNKTGVFYLIRVKPQVNHSGVYTCKVTVKVITVSNGRHRI